jgi:type I restriction enzyme, S subunit
MTKPGFKRTALGDMPLEWEMKKLEDVARELNERAENARDAPVLSVTKYDGFVPSLEYFKKQIFSRSTENYKLVRRNQFAYSTIHLDEGAISLLEDFEAGLISPMYTVFETDAKKVDPKFFSYQLRSDELIQMYGQIGQGSVNRRKSIGFSAFGSIEIRLPPLLEQQRIAAILSSVDDLLESSQRVLDQVRELRRGVMQNVLTRGVPGWHEEFKDSEFGRIPRAWEQAKLGDHFNKPPSSGYSPKEAFTFNGIYVLSLGCISEDGFFPKSLKFAPELSEVVINRFKLKDGDFLISRANGNPNLVGLVGIFKDFGQNCIYPDLMLRLNISSAIGKEYLFHWMNNPEIRKRVVNSLQGSSTMMKLNSSLIGQIPILIPPLLEQEKIVSILSSFDQRIQTETQRITSLEHLKKGLMQHLLTGKLRVKLEVAS